MKQLLDGHEFSDITLHVDGKTFQAHKIILARSRKLNPLVEGNNELKIEDASADIFQCLLEYLYTNQITVPSPKPPNFYKNLYKLAKVYEVNGLVRSLEPLDLEDDLPDINPFLLSTIAEDIEKYGLREIHTDISFEVEDKIIPAHKVLIHWAS